MKRLLSVRSIPRTIVAPRCGSRLRAAKCRYRRCDDKDGMGIDENRRVLILFFEKMCTFAKIYGSQWTSFENKCLSLQRKNHNRMSYTAEPIVISNPSEKLLEVIKKMREHKLSELEKLRNMNPDEFSCRIFLKWFILLKFQQAQEMNIVSS